MISVSCGAYNPGVLSQSKREERRMDWADLLAYVTGMVNEKLLRRNEYLATKNRILKDQLKGRVSFEPDQA